MSRNYVFTVNNPPDGEPKWPDYIRYAIWQLERGDAGTLHWQGYLEMGVPKRLSALKLIPGLEKAHFEKRMGTRDQARDYCRKVDSRVSGPYEFGNWDAGGQGRRSDLSVVAEAVVGGKNLREIAEEYPVQTIKYARGIANLRMLRMLPRSHKTLVTILYGAPGVGKTHWCAEEAKGRSVCWAPPFKKDAVWFDGYDGQDILVLDDFRGEIEFSFVLRLFDKFELKVPVKGGFAEFVAKEIYVTTNVDPRIWYAYSEEKKQMSALIRRVENWVYFSDFKAYTLCNEFTKFESLLDQ